MERRKSGAAAPARMNTCRICGAAFAPKTTRPDGTLCPDQECRNESRRRQMRQYVALASGKPPLPAAPLPAPGYCACGAKATRCASCEECFQALTLRVSIGIYTAAHRLSGRRGDWANEA